MNEPDRKPKWWRKLSQSLSKSRHTLSYQVKSIFTAEKLTEDDWESLEEILIGADVGLETTATVVDRLRQEVLMSGTHNSTGLYGLLRSELVRALAGDGPIEEKPADRAHIILIVGVNGTGKTTTIGKLAKLFRDQGSRVLLVAADTFRAAAVEQLQLWCERVGAEIIKHQRGADPGAVVFDAIGAMRSGKYDCAVIDTAGRLHTYVNLMEELQKVKRILLREAGDRFRVVTLLVMDATTGQNGIAQAKLFHEALSLDGLVLSKLDGSAKGGVVLAVRKQLGIPVVYVGTGEQPDDLAPFSPEDFIDALLGLEFDDEVE